MLISPILAGLILLMCFLWSRRRFCSLIFELPGPLGLPLLGSAPQYIKNNFKLNLRTKYMEKYGSTILTWVGIQPVLLSGDPRIAEDIVTSPQCLNRTSRVTKALESVLGPGLLSLQGTAWIKRRKLINASFKPNVLLSFFPNFNSETRRLVAQIDTFVGQEETDLLPHLLKWSFSIAHQTTLDITQVEEKMFGTKAVLESGPSLPNLIVFSFLIPLLQNKILSQIFGFEETKATLNSQMDQIINYKLNHTEDLSHSVITRVMELYRNGEISFEEMRGECCNIIQAATDTTVATVNHTLILLAMFPQYQDIVFEELKYVFPAGEDFEVEYADLQKLEYLDRVLKETLRLIPSITTIVRELNEDFRLSNNVLVPKGVACMVDIFHIHRNKDYWGPNAESFNPDNFLGDNVRKRHPFAYIPFSKGKRNCIGWNYALLSSKIALARILRNYKISTTFRYEDLVFVDGVVIKLSKSPPLRFQRRTSK